MRYTYTIAIDDDDRDDNPGEPWTAVLFDETHNMYDASGAGATHRDAIADLVKDLPPSLERGP